MQVYRGLWTRKLAWYFLCRWILTLLYSCYSPELRNADVLVVSEQ